MQKTGVCGTVGHADLPYIPVKSTSKKGGGKNKLHYLPLHFLLQK